MTWLIARLSEGSTWRGVIWLLTALGVSLSPEAWVHITTIGMAVAGLMGVLTSEKSTRVDIQLPSLELIGQVGNTDRANPVADRSAVNVSVPAQPDYRPKKPDSPVDLTNGWSG